MPLPKDQLDEIMEEMQDVLRTGKVKPEKGAKIKAIFDKYQGDQNAIFSEDTDGKGGKVDE